MLLDETMLIPAGVAVRPEKIGTHVVVDAVDLPAKAAKVIDEFRSDKTGGTGDEQGIHLVSLHMDGFGMSSLRLF